MKTKAALRRAWEVYKASPADMLVYLLVMLIAALLPLVPLLCLAGKSIRWFALLSVPLYVFVSAPMRMNAAAVLQKGLRTGKLVNSGLVDFSGYGTKLTNALKNTLLLLVWGATGIAATAYIAYIYTGATDVGTIALSLSRIGGDIQTGFIYVLLIYLACWLPLLAGFCFHSGTRHAQALSGRALLKGHRGGVIRTWLCSFVIALPFVIAVAAVLCHYVPDLAKALNRFNMDAMKTLGKSMLLWLGGSVLVLLLPLIPLRHLMVAAYVGGLQDAADRKEENAAE